MPLNNFSRLEKLLYDRISEMEIIDCHEHLPPERERLKETVDFFTLFSHYTKYDLLNTGMSEEQYQSLFNRDIPLSNRWKVFSPYWEKCRWTSYSKSVLLTVKKLYGFDDINECNYEKISDAIIRSNKPGLYEKVLSKTCRIRTCLNNCNKITDFRTPLLTQVIRLCDDYVIWNELNHPLFDETLDINSLDEFIEAVRKYISDAKLKGAVGLKIVARPYGVPDIRKANYIFAKLKSGSEVKQNEIYNPLKDYIIDCAIKFAYEEDMVIAVHAGYWRDFRNYDPLHLIPIIMRYPEARFDIYHLGYPWVRETLMLGKGFPNVWLNFCWTHIISQKFTMDALDEAIDLLPVNKILAFGGDYRVVEKVCGHLEMAREDIVRVLAKRIKQGDFTETQAIDIAEKFLLKNPMVLYKLAGGPI